MKILVVDDDIVSLNKMKAIFTKYGSVDIVDNGTEAIELMQRSYEANEPYDLCTMDIEMPLLDGTETVARIRKMESNLNIVNKLLKIIMITIKGNDKNIISSFYNGCEWYIKKPVTPIEIEKSLKHLKLI